jgi:hypothetical protein
MEEVGANSISTYAKSTAAFINIKVEYFDVLVPLCGVVVIANLASGWNDEDAMGSGISKYSAGP